MKIFDKRPLSLILCVMLGTFVFFAFYDYPLAKILTVIIILCAIVISFIKPLSVLINTLLIRIVAICALIAVIFSFLYFDLWFKAYERFDGEVQISGTVTDMKASSYRTALYIKTDKIDDAPFSEYNLIVYVNTNEQHGFSPGTKVTLSGIIENFTASENTYDIESYYFSRGISGVINEVENLNITEINDFTFEYKIYAFREKLCRKIIYTSDQDTGGLLCALLLGQKEYLPLGTSLDFSRIGISHILALSGMHLAILSLGFSKLMMFFRVGKKPATLFTILFTLVYMCLTGFSVSVTRAGIMLIVSSVLFLLSRTRDSLTSLVVAVTLICIFEPYSIYDTSLWLSAFATLGIVVMSEYQNEKYTKQSFSKWILTSILSSFFAISATFAITALKFDSTSILAPISTLVFSVLCEVFLYIGIFLLIFGSIVPIKFLLIPIGNVIIELAEWLSGFEWVCFSTNFLVIEILSLIYSVAFFGFFVFSVKHKKAYIISLCVMLSFVFVFSGILTYSENSKTDIIYSSENYERILISDDGKLCVTDISDYDKKSAFSLYTDMADTNVTEIDKLIITHYSYDLYEYIKTIFDYILIRELYLPIPQNQTEERICLDISDLLTHRSVSPIIYEREDIIDLGIFALVPLYNSEIGTAKKNLLTIYDNEYFYTYLSVDMLSGETKNMALEVISGSRVIIFGRHESKNSDYKFTYKLEGVEKLIFSSNRILIHKDTLEYYKKCDVYLNPYTKISLIR